MTSIPRLLAASLVASSMLAGPMLAGSALAQTLTVVTAGDQNMVDYVNEYLAPMFEEQHPGVSVRALGTGPGDAGSQMIYERLAAQAAAGAEAWDTDVIVVHQKMAGQMVQEDLLAAYRDKIETGALVTRDTALMALGTPVDGFVMPMFHSQTAIAYNPHLIEEPPASLEELIAWVEEHPGQFGYNGIKGGMSGVAFVVGWMYAHSDDPEQLMNGPFDASTTERWADALARLRDFNRHVTLTPGNAGTLDMLNRGEIAMGPVWVDMFYTWQADGRLSPDLRLSLPEPGLPGQPMYYAVPARAENADLAAKFIELATSPAVQAEGIVTQFNWYPGIDADHVRAELDDATWERLFVDITPDDLAGKGKPFPIADYFDEILEAYERNVE
jgi:putative spermidine/putrescine transport system substrate-binding protein